MLVLTSEDVWQAHSLPDKGGEKNRELVRHQDTMNTERSCQSTESYLKGWQTLDDKERQIKRHNKWKYRHW